MVSAAVYRAVALPLELLVACLAVVLLAVVIPWFVMAMRELGPPARHRARPPARPQGGRGMPIPLGQLPPLPLGPWPAGGCLSGDGRARYVPVPTPDGRGVDVYALDSYAIPRPATMPMPASVVAEFDKLRAMIDAWGIEGPA